ncbi:hypothetical protein ACFLWX_04190 [Chloroflexota bacterium]
MNLQRRGIPTVTISYDTFEVAARAQAKAAGFPAKSIVSVKHWEPGFTPEMARAEIKKLCDKIFSLLIIRTTISTKTKNS